MNSISLSIASTFYFISLGHFIVLDHFIRNESAYGKKHEYRIYATKVADIRIVIRIALNSAKFKDNFGVDHCQICHKRSIHLKKLQIYKEHLFIVCVRPFDSNHMTWMKQFHNVVFSNEKILI